MALDPLTAGIDLAKDLVNKFWPDKTEQEKQQMAMVMMMVQGQLETNKVEAASQSLFVAGWRPAVGWICALSFGFRYIGGPLLTVIGQLTGHQITLPVIDYAEMSPILIGMLGLGYFRSTEKIKGVA